MTTLLATLQTIALLCANYNYPASCQRQFVECHFDKGKELTTCIKEKK